MKPKLLIVGLLALTQSVKHVAFALEGDELKYDETKAVQTFPDKKTRRVVEEVCPLKKWEIVAPEDVGSMMFSDMGNNIKIAYRQNNRQFNVKLFDNCDKSANGRRETVPDDVVHVETKKENDDEGCSEITVTLIINVGMLDNSVVYTTGLNPNTGWIEICIEMALLSDENLFEGGWNGNGDQALSSYTEVTFNQMTLQANFDFEEGFVDFSIDSTVNLGRDEVEELENDAFIDYSVVACECNKKSQCYDQFPDLVKPVITQSSYLYLCLSVFADDVHIKSVQQLNLTKSIIILPAIVNGRENNLTFVNRTSDQSVIITTNLVSLFFETIHSTVGAKGHVILDYATRNADADSGRRRELTVSFDTNNRKLNSDEVEAPFNLSGIKLGYDVSASGMNLFWMRGLLLCGFILSLAVNLL